MATEQGTTQMMMQAANEAVKAAIIAVRDADKPVNKAQPMHNAYIKWPSTKTTNIWLESQR